jgi:hypothetical protein
MKPILFTLALLIVPAFAAVSSPEKVDASKSKDSATAAKPYPLKVCIVTDNDLDSMGDESSFIHEGQTVKFCCPPCEKKFLKNPARYLAKLTPPSNPGAPK